MSWGSTAFTPIVSRNEPPFGFHETQNPPDYPVSDWNPYVASDYLKESVADSNYQSCTADSTYDCLNDLRNQTGELREGFSSGSTFFVLTLILTIVSGVISDKVAFAIGSKFSPVNAVFDRIPEAIRNRLPAKLLNSTKKLQKLVTKALPISDIVYNIALPIMVFFTMWLFNAFIMQTVIYQDCRRLNQATIKTSFASGLAGAIPTTIFVVIAGIILFILNRIPIFTPFLSIAGALGGLTFAIITVMLGTNFIFSGAAGVTSARNNGCAAPAPA